MGWIQLKPPFDTRQGYTASIGSQAAGAASEDTSTVTDLDLVEHEKLKRGHGELHAPIHAAGKTLAKWSVSCLMMISGRLLELKRMLEDAGAIYLHRDPSSSPRRKLEMDGVFGAGGFQSEITWK